MWIWVFKRSMRQRGCARIKRAVLESAEELGLSIANLDRTRSRREYNRYEIPLPSIDGTSFNEQLIVETAVMTPAIRL